MAVLDFVLNLQFVVGLVVGWKVLPFLIDYAKKFLNR
jgi:hypothetical protein